MPNRILRADILSSEAIASLKWDEEVFYRRVMSIVDDYGRHEGNPQLLRSKCYPLQTDQVRVADISRWLAACQKAGVILCYDVDGKQYIEVQKFGQKVRTDSKCPPPQTNASKCQQMSANDRLGVCADIGEVGVEDEGVIRDGARQSAADAILEVYHRVLPRCQHISVLNDKRKKRIAAAVKLARSVCEQQGWQYVADDFWGAYFDECTKDAWMRGEVANPKNPSWKQNLDVLIAEDRFAGIMDRAIESMRGAA